MGAHTLTLYLPNTSPAPLQLVKPSKNSAEMGETSFPLSLHPSLPILSTHFFFCL